MSISINGNGLIEYMTVYRYYGITFVYDQTIVLTEKSLLTLKMILNCAFEKSRRRIYWHYD